MFKNLKKNKKGFSLVELIVVIAIMAVLVGVLAPTLLTNIEKSRESKDIQVLDSVASAVQMALADEKAEAKKPAGKVTLHLFLMLRTQMHSRQLLRKILAVRALLTLNYQVHQLQHQVMISTSALMVQVQ